LFLGYVGTNYTLSHNKPYLNFITEYLHSVSFKIKSIKCLIRAKNYIAKYKSYESWKFKSVVKFYVPTFTDPRGVGRGFPETFGNLL